MKWKYQTSSAFEVYYYCRTDLCLDPINSMKINIHFYLRDIDSMQGYWKYHGLIKYPQY